MDLDMLLRLKSEIGSIRMKLAMRRLGLAIKFDQSQPRVPSGQAGGGQWTADGATEVTSSIRDVSSIKYKQPIRLAFRTENDCDDQYKRDIFQCRMVGSRSCYAQAMVRLVACERGHPIPPLNY